MCSGVGNLSKELWAAGYAGKAFDAPCLHSYAIYSACLPYSMLGDNILRHKLRIYVYITVEVPWHQIVLMNHLYHM